MPVVPPDQLQGSVWVSHIAKDNKALRSKIDHRIPKRVSQITSFDNNLSIGLNRVFSTHVFNTISFIQNSIGFYPSCNSPKLLIMVVRDSALPL